MPEYRVVIEWGCREREREPMPPSRLSWKAWPELLVQVRQLRWLALSPRKHRIYVESREPSRYA